MYWSRELNKYTIPYQKVTGFKLRWIRSFVYKISGNVRGIIVALFYPHVNVLEQHWQEFRIVCLSVYLVMSGSSLQPNQLSTYSYLNELELVWGIPPPVPIVIIKIVQYNAIFFQKTWKTKHTTALAKNSAWNQRVPVYFSRRRVTTGFSGRSLLPEYSFF